MFISSAARPISASAQYETLKQTGELEKFIEEMEVAPEVRYQQKRASLLVNLVVGIFYIMSAIVVVRFIYGHLRQDPSANAGLPLEAAPLAIGAYFLSKGQNKARLALGVLSILCVLGNLLAFLFLQSEFGIGIAGLIFLTLGAPFIFCAYLLFYDVSIREELLRRVAAADNTADSDPQNSLNH